MKKNIVLIILSLLFTMSCSSVMQNKLCPREKLGGWELLFDGKTTDGWRDYLGNNIGEGWVAQDGLLYCKGLGGDIGGDIISEKKYDNFILKMEWKISKGGNSGIFYHIVEDKKYNAPYFTAPEYQVIDDIGFPHTLEEWQKTGADYAMYNANEKKQLKPQGEWNTTKIIFDHGHVEHWLNGKKIVEFEAWATDWKQKKANGKWHDFPDYGISKSGNFGLQDHGNKVWYKNIKVKKI